MVDTAKNDPNLENKSLSELNEIRNLQLDSVSNKAKQIIDNIRFKLTWLKALIGLARNLNECEDKKSAQETDIVDQSKLLSKLENLGVKISFQSDFDIEAIGEKPVLLLSNHQGGGFEDYIMRALLDKVNLGNFDWIVKDSLLKYPVLGKILNKTDSIPVDRSNPRTIFQVMETVAERLNNDQNVFMFFEGHRSKDREIQDSKYAKHLMNHLEKYISTDEYKKVLVVVDTMDVLPKQFEKNPFCKARINGQIAIHIHELSENTSFDPKEANNIFQQTRNHLKNIVITAIENDL